MVVVVFVIFSVVVFFLMKWNFGIGEVGEIFFIIVIGEVFFFILFGFLIILEFEILLFDEEVVELKLFSCKVILGLWCGLLDKWDVGLDYILIVFLFWK